MRTPPLKTMIAIPAVILLGLCLIVILPDIVLASDGTHGLGQTAGVSGFASMSDSLPSIIGGIVQGLLGLVGVIFLVLMIYAGFLWMTAGGNEETVKKARSLIVGAVAGMAIIFAAYAITTFVVNIVAPPGDVPAEGGTIPSEDPLEESLKDE